MDAYNATAGNEHSSGLSRPVEKYQFRLPRGVRGRVSVQRLMANGSDAVTGVTWDGYSYDYELKNGMPVLQRNVTRGEEVQVGEYGVLGVEVPWSSAAALSFDC